MTALTRSHLIVMLTSLISFLALAGCSGSSGSPDSDTAPDALEHIHGLGINPADQQLYAATHHGVYRVIERTVQPVGPRQDTMGFTVAGPSQFLASGHPATADQPNPLGLIESRDEAESWTTVAFAGQADFHALDASGPRILAYSADRGELFAGVSAGSLTSIGRYALFDVAADPVDPDRVLLTSDKGRLMSLTVGQEPRPVGGAPLLGPIDYATDRVVVGLGGEGEVYSSRDDGATWRMVKDLPGTSQAVVAENDQWYVATTEGIVGTADQGRTWTTYYKVSP